MDYYELFDVSASASAGEIRAAYVRLSKRVHPDSGGSAALFRQVEEAYRVLSDPATRSRYDRDRLENRGTGSRPPTRQVVTPQDLAEMLLRTGSAWAKSASGRRAERKAEALRLRQAIWPKTIGLDFLRVDLQAWLPFLTGARTGETRCSASWARKDLVEPPLALVLGVADDASPPRRMIWRVEDTDDQWVSWRTGTDDGSEIELRLRFDASPGARPRWARRQFPAGTHMVVSTWNGISDPT